MAKQDGPHRLAFAALLIGSASLALGSWMVRLADTGPVASAFWRLALAVPMLALLSKVVGRPLRWPGKRLAIAISIAAIFFAADLAAWHVSIGLTKLGNATLFGNISSFAFAAWGLWLTRRWPGPLQAAALILAASGSALLMGQSAELGAAHLRGDLLAMLAGILYGFYLILVERSRGTVEPLPLLVLASSVGALFLLPLALAMGERVIPGNWGPLIALALGSQVIGQGLLVFAIGEVSPLVVGLALLTQPAISAMIGWLVYGERLNLLDWLGAGAIGLALVLVRLRPAPPSAT